MIGWKTESPQQQLIRLEAPRQGWGLLRNNSGAVTTADGRHIRFGLGNDSARVNEVFKSSDLIGIRPVIITPDMVGMTIGQFVAVEVKKPGWNLTPGDKRAQAQLRFGEWVRRHGGEFWFATGPSSIWLDTSG